MQLYYFLLVIVSLACGSLPPRSIDWWPAVGATLGMVTGWILLSHVAARTVSNHVLNETVDPLAGANWLEKQLNAFRWMGLGVAVLCLSGFGIARGLDSVPVVANSMLLQGLILLMPGMAITMGTWSAEHHYGVRLDYTNAGWRGHVSALLRSFRGGMAWLVVPVWVLLAMSDLIGWLPISDEAKSWVSILGILLFVPLGMPWMIRKLFKTVPMNEVDQAWISRLMQAAGAGKTRVVRWDTGGHQFNAMVAGFMPPVRTLFLSDRLLDELPTHQIAMVVLHEAAHLKRHHMPIRMIGVLPAWIIGTLVTRFAGEQTWAMAAGSAAGILMTLVILRFISYRTEYDADVTACRMAQALASEFDQLPVDYIDASKTLSDALMRVTFEHPSARKSSWLHPSVADRITTMEGSRPARSWGEPVAGL